MALNPERLVELDGAWLGRRVVLGEYAVGVVGATALGMLSLAYAIRSGGIAGWSTWLGVELLGVGLNYVPLLLHAFRLRDVPKQTFNTGEARSYGLRQAWILVPGAVVVFAALARRRP